MNTITTVTNLTQVVAGVDYRNVNKLINKNQIVFSGIITVPGGVQSISSQCGAQNRSIRVTCELVRNVNSQDPDLRTQTMGGGGGAPRSQFNPPSRWLFCVVSIRKSHRERLLDPEETDTGAPRQR